jgi:hypothetical protein
VNTMIGLPAAARRSLHCGSLDAGSYAFGQGMTALVLSIGCYCPWLTGAARERQLWTVFLDASKDGKIALIHQLATETLHIGCASSLLLVRAAGGIAASERIIISMKSSI